MGYEKEGDELSKSIARFALLVANLDNIIRKLSDTDVSQKITPHPPEFSPEIHQLETNTYRNPFGNNIELPEIIK